VADFYYELADCLVPKWGSKYKVIRSRSGAEVMAGGFRLTADSNRIWCEQDNVVWFLKNKDSQPHDTPVDLKEFMWIKLSAQDLRETHG
jgi:hypothetical protein